MINTALASEGGEEAAELSIHLAPTILGYLGGLPITNTLVMTWFVMAVLIITSLLIRRNLKEKPGKFQLVFEEIIGYIKNFIEDTLQDKALSTKVFPLITTIFLFILATNWIGLLPGVDTIGIHINSHGEDKFVGFLHPGNTDLNATIALALIAFFTIETIGIIKLGGLTYLSKFITFKSPMAFMVGIIELFSEFARLISFAFRLFGNIFAGKTLLLVAVFFVPYIVPVPLLGFEMFVGFIQAFIFAILTLFFIKLATEAPH